MKSLVTLGYLYLTLTRFGIRMLQDMEELFYGPPTATSIEICFITGLPRSGTTALLEGIVAKKNLGVSPTYASLVALAAPRLSKTVSRVMRKWGLMNADRLQARAHGDGMLTSLNSPEAFDEILLRVCDPHSTLSNLSTATDLHRYEFFCRSLADAEGQNRLVFKNNSIFKHFTALVPKLESASINVKVICVVRSFDEVFVSYQSTLSNFKKLSWADRKYIDLIGHSEFGELGIFLGPEFKDMSLREQIARWYIFVYRFWIELNKISAQALFFISNEQIDRFCATCADSNFFKSNNVFVDNPKFINIDFLTKIYYFSRASDFESELSVVESELRELTARLGGI